MISLVGRHYKNIGPIIGKGFSRTIFDASKLKDLLKKKGEIPLPPGAIAVSPITGTPRVKDVKEDDCGTVDESDNFDDFVNIQDPDTKEIGGPTYGGTRPEPTRFGDWERKGRCSDF